MRTKKNHTAAPALPTAAPAISHSSVKRKSALKLVPKVEDLATPKQMLDELLKQIIAEAKSFRRPDKRQERQDGEE
jgi:hypothetical protein